MYKVNAQQMKSLIKAYYKANASLMTYGGFGIGKSQITEQAAIELAESKQKEFKNWNTLTMAERDELFKAPEKYFVYVDVRLSQNDNTDLKGLPKFDGDDEAV